MDEPKDQENDRLLPLIQALNKASKALKIKHVHSIFHHNHAKPAIETMLELREEAKSVICSEPSLFKLSQSLTELITLFVKLEKLHECNVVALFYRQITKLEISRIAHSIETITQSLLDRKLVAKLLSALTDSARDDGEKVEALIEFEDRLSQGFDREFQELILRGKVFPALELCLSGESQTRSSERVQSRTALAVLALVEFNKEVFVGLVLMGPTTRSLVSIASVSTIRVLCSLVGRIKTILVDEIESAGEIPRIVNLLGSDDIRLRLAAMDVALEIAGFGKKEAVEAMIVEECLVKKLMDLQRDMETEVDREEEEVKENLALGNYVARLAVKVEIGEGLEKREKRELRSEILRFVREYSVSQAESVSIVADIMWGSSGF